MGLRDVIDSNDPEDQQAIEDYEETVRNSRDDSGSSSNDDSDDVVNDPSYYGPGGNDRTPTETGGSDGTDEQESSTQTGSSSDGSDETVNDPSYYGPGANDRTPTETGGSDGTDEQEPSAQTGGSSSSSDDTGPVDRGTTVLPDARDRLTAVDERLEEQFDPSRTSIRERNGTIVAEYFAEGQTYRQEFRFEDRDRLQNLRSNARARATDNDTVEYIDAVRFNDASAAYSDERQMALVEETLREDFGNPRQLSVSQTDREDVYRAEAQFGDSTFTRLFSFGATEEGDLIESATPREERSTKQQRSQPRDRSMNNSFVNTNDAGRGRVRDTTDYSTSGSFVNLSEDGSGVARNLNQARRDAVSQAVNDADSAADTIDWDQAARDPVGFLRGAGREREKALLQPISKYGDGARNAIDDINRRLTPGDDVYTDRDFANDIVGGLSDNKEGVATAAAAGVVAPEPVSTVGGALTLGGLAVAGIAGQMAIDQYGSEIDVPQEERQPEVEVPAQPASTSTNEIEAPEDASSTVSEISVPSDGSMQQSEVEVPAQDQPEVLTISTAELQYRGRQQAREKNREEEEEDTDPLADALREMERSQRRGFGHKPPESYVDVDEGDDYLYQNWEPVSIVREEDTAEASQSSEMLDATESAQSPSVDVDVGSFGQSTSRPDTIPLVDEAQDTQQDQGENLADEVVNVGDQQQGQRSESVVDQTPTTDLDAWPVTVGDVGASTEPATDTPTASETTTPSEFDYPDLYETGDQPSDGYGYPSPTGYGRSRPRRRGSDRESEEQSFNFGFGVGGGPREEERFAPGWLSETVTDIATEGQRSEDPLSQDDLAGFARDIGLGGELPTAEMVRGDKRTQERIEDVESLLSFGSDESDEWRWF